MSYVVSPHAKDGPIHNVFEVNGKEADRKKELEATTRRLDQECHQLATMLFLTTLMLTVLVALLFVTFWVG